MTHNLKAWPEFFDPVYTGKKRFELRKDDRGFQVDDKLLLQEYDPASGKYTGREVIVIVTYILRDIIGLDDDYVIMTVVKESDIKKERKKEKQSAFNPPEKTEVQNFFINECKMSFTNAEDLALDFWNFYESKGWKVGDQKMVSWTSAAYRFHKSNAHKYKGNKSTTHEPVYKLL
jgi:hypothetical protein